MRYEIPVVMVAEGENRTAAELDAKVTLEAMSAVQDEATFRLAPEPVFIVAEDMATVLIGPFPSADAADEHIAFLESRGSCAELTVVTMVVPPADDRAAWEDGTPA